MDYKVFHGCTSLKSVILSENLTTIGNQMFYECTNLESIIIPNSVTSIGSIAFQGCSSLMSISIGNGVTSIGTNAFRECTSLTSVEIPNNVSIIADQAFYSCTSLKSVTIPKSVTRIGSMAFKNCSNLTSVTVGIPSPLTINSQTFTNRKNATLYVPLGSKAAYQAADYWKDFYKIIERDMSHEPIQGDVNGDGAITITDVSMVVAFILGVQSDAFIAAYADVNGDGSITITDVAEIVKTILNGSGNTPQAYLTCPDDHHPHLIDLGLPSGTLWACCNVDTEHPENQSPTNYGGYYAWGETAVKDYYDEDTYEFFEGYDYWTETWIDSDGEEYEEYYYAPIFTILSSDIAGTRYDVAHVKWGGSWVMPSHTQMLELMDNCTSIWTTQNGIEGMAFTGPNGGTIFLPAAEECCDGSIVYRTDIGSYWSSTPETYSDAYRLYFDSDGTNRILDYRYYGLTVRPVSSASAELSLSLSSVAVTAGQSTTVEIISGSGSYEVSSSDSDVATATLFGTIVTITGKSPGMAVMNVKDKTTGNTKPISVIVSANHSCFTCPDNHHPHMIDLGLPSGTKWACCNVDADHPENQSPTYYGGYYAWGELDGNKDYYDWSTYIYYDESDFELDSDIAGTQFDVAHMKWGGSWVMPSLDQIEELFDNCTYKWTSINGVNGGLFTSKANGGTIFLPAAGRRWQDHLYTAGSSGNYWASTQHPWDSDYAFDLYFDSGTSGWLYYYRYNGRPVRPVSQ